jgi:hypothetical protein
MLQKSAETNKKINTASAPGEIGVRCSGAVKHWQLQEKYSIIDKTDGFADKPACGRG